MKGRRLFLTTAALGVLVLGQHPARGQTASG